MSDLFSQAETPAGAPLADRMRPRSLDEYIGQSHIVGPGCLLRRAILRDRLSSLILSGPPGTGKTTLARVIAKATQARFVAINAVLSGVQAIRDTIEAAKRERDLYDRRTILFVDEVHRWNKAQQDALLPWVENGTVILIGATTENPYFEVNKALVSRSRVFQLQSLSEAELVQAAHQALADRDRGYGCWPVDFAPGALEHLVKTAGGDARAMLNALELAVETSVDSWPAPEGSRLHISLDAAEQSIQKRAVLYDKDGDAHYDAISAFIKSLRGSDADASLYWLARMVYAGEDPHFIFRRMIISAAEDVGLADPQAVAMVQSCAAAFDRIGLPEGQFLLAEACLYLATAPKSNSSLAYFDALAAVEREMAEVPNHLKDANRDAQGLGHGQGYHYPHAYRGHWVAQQYLPDSLKGLVFYRPGNLGYEAAIREATLSRRDLQLAAIFGQGQAANPGDGDVIITDAARQATERTDPKAWQRRATQADADSLARVRSSLLELAELSIEHHILLPNADDGLLSRECFRACPEGSLTAILGDKAALERLTWQFNDVEDSDKPRFIVSKRPQPAVLKATQAGTKTAAFNRIIGMNWLGSAREAGLGAWAEAFPKARLVLAERLPSAQGILSRLELPGLEAGLLEGFRSLDDEFYASEHRRARQQAMELLEAGGYRLEDSRDLDLVGRRALHQTELERWFGTESAWGRHLATGLGETELKAIRDSLIAGLRAGDWPELDWPQFWLLFSAMPDRS